MGNITIVLFYIISNDKLKQKIMKEIYVKPKIADLLKKLDFDWRCDSAYSNAFTHNGQIIDEDEEFELKCEGRGKEIKRVKYGSIFNHNYSNEDNFSGCAARPTLDVARKWIREILGVDIIIGICKHDFGQGNEKAYVYECIKITEDDTIEFSEDVYFHTYEEAEENAILYALKETIKNNKNKLN